MIDKNSLIDWCWCNIQFNNTPETWQDTCVVDILNGYNGSCHDNNGYAHTYQDIRNMFTIYKEDDSNDSL